MKQKLQDADQENMEEPISLEIKVSENTLEKEDRENKEVNENMDNI